MKRIARLLAVVVFALATSAFAQTWPAKPIKWIVPFAPGGTTDILARTIGEKLTIALGQPIIVENRPGAGGALGAEFTAKAPADGYTIMGGTISTHAINASLYKNLPYDPVILDITTSTVAEGKLMVAMNKGDTLPAGWIVDKDGKPTTDPREFYAGGALLTIGAHKGSGLSIVTDLLAGAVTTGRSSDPQDKVLRNNMLSIFIAPAVYDPSGGVLHEAARFIEFVKASPPAIPGQPVKAPGDVEREMRMARVVHGIPVDETTWSDLTAAAQSVGIDSERASALIA